MTDDFTTAHSNYIDGTYDCVDRIVVNAYFVLGKTPGGFRNWWRLLYGSDDNLDDTRLMRLAGRVSRRVHAWQRRAVYQSKTVLSENASMRWRRNSFPRIPSSKAFS